MKTILSIAILLCSLLLIEFPAWKGYLSRPSLLWTTLTAPKDIRLLEVDAGNAEDPVRASLSAIHWSPSNRPLEYETLSNFWESSELTHWPYVMV